MLIENIIVSSFKKQNNLNVRIHPVFLGIKINQPRPIIDLQYESHHSSKKIFFQVNMLLGLETAASH